MYMAITLRNIATRMVCVFQMPSELAELEQLHVKPNSEHSTSLHHSFTHCRWWNDGWGLETRL